MTKLFVVSVSTLIMLSTASAAWATSMVSKKQGESLGKFTVQVAAFDDETQAKAFVANLKSEGYRAFTVPVHLKGRNWYRIGIGLFSTQSEAKTYRAELLSKMKTAEAIIREVD